MSRLNTTSIAPHWLGCMHWKHIQSELHSSIHSLPNTSGLRSWEGESDISRVHAPSALSPQQCTVMNSQFLKPSLELSNSLEGRRNRVVKVSERRGEQKRILKIMKAICYAHFCITDNCASFPVVILQRRDTEHPWKC